MIILWIRSPLTTYVKCKWRAYNTLYAYNSQYDRSAMFFVVIKIVRPDTQTGLSEIKTKMETTRMYQLLYDTPKANLYISEWIDEISIVG